MTSDPLYNPVHPCHGCLMRGQILPYDDKRVGRVRPGSTCPTSGRWQQPVFAGDPLPQWCPGKETRGNRE